MHKILDTIEPSLRLSDAQPLLNDLHNAIHELRNLPPPSSGAISGLNEGPLVWSHPSSPQVIPPFKDIDAFHEMLFSRVIYKTRLPRLRRLARPVHAKQHRIRFTHADLHVGNIIVKDGRLAAIIDWEFAGWYPEYCECISIQTQALRQKASLAFWDAVGAFADGKYGDEKVLHTALLGSAGNTAVPDDVAPDLAGLGEEL
ncbi:putative choline/ethanolamine kinase [Lyophyllum shimeji]|uniref:Choline/ethanolamine kinase n=1 Tax=Lyophyllum shimeji TaxID=47721 RepID=A0A9P3PQ41_LYOSH|nr:putative choline/ethanolamine kinase [Lyophyllum shimeji]